MMAKKYDDLRSMTKSELVELYDGHTQNTVVGLDWIRREIERREAEEQTAELMRLSRRMDRLTIINVALAAASLISAVASFIVALNAA